MAMSVVLDTNVLVAALRSNVGASFALVRRLPIKGVQLVLSVPLYVEYQDVLLRPNMLPVGTSLAQATGFLRYIASISRHHEIHFLWRPFLSDPKDDMLLELAVAAQAGYIVTHNIRHFATCTAFGVQAMSPGEFIGLLDWDKEA
jgi:putative PIN family toxin of toxin-antitoxin system